MIATVMHRANLTTTVYKDDDDRDGNYNEKQNCLFTFARFSVLYIGQTNTSRYCK